MKRDINFDTNWNISGKIKQHLSLKKFAFLSSRFPKFFDLFFGKIGITRFKKKQKFLRLTGSSRLGRPD